MNKGLLCLLIPLLLIPAKAADDFLLVYPDLVTSCIKKPSASMIEVNEKIMPWYLRGDFDGDGESDYAVAIRGKTTKRNGVLICDAKGRTFVLGADNPTRPPFSDLPGDNFVAENWVVFTRKEAVNLTKRQQYAPRPFAVLGETIAMVFENAIGIIYWDGRRYLWAPSR